MGIGAAGVTNSRPSSPIKVDVIGGQYGSTAAPHEDVNVSFLTSLIEKEENLG